MRKLALWGEGDREKRFLDAIVKPRLVQHFHVIKILEYSQRNSVEINKLVQSMSYGSFEYLFTADQDQSPCISLKAQKLLNKFPALDRQRVIIVDREIEA